LLRQPTEKELLHGEQMLKNAEDYDRKQHARFAHFYEYGYRYLPGELILDGRSFNPIKNTTITKTADTPQTLQMIWNTAIENTFGRFRDDAPPNGFYVRYKINLLTPTRVHLIMPTNPIGVDLGDEGNDESPATFGQDEINTQIKFTAVAVRSRTRKLETLKKNLRERIVEDRNMMVYISFHLNDRELRYTLGDTSHIPPKPIESVSSSR